MKDDVAVGANAPVAPPWELKMLPLDDMKAEIAAPVTACSDAECLHLQGRRLANNGATPPAKRLHGSYSR